MKQEIIIDAKGRSLGRVASEAAVALRGKKSASFERHIMPDTSVIIKNASETRYTGKKVAQKKYKRYSGYPGGLRTTALGVQLKKNPRKVLLHAIRGMIPDNRLRKGILKNVKIYEGETA